MGEQKLCVHCVWADQCFRGVACEYYDPIDDGERLENIRKEYEESLQERHDAYMDGLTD